MPILLISAQKGGVGKTTIAFNIAATLAQQSRDVIIVDADCQASASAWWAERSRNRPDLPAIACVQKHGNIEKTLTDLNKRYEYVIVDCAGRESEEMRSGMVCADVMVIPTRPSQIDLMTLTTMSILIQKAISFNTKLIAYCLINMAPTNKKISEVEDAKKVISEYREVILLETMLSDRKRYRDSMITGSGVTEMDGKAISDKLAQQEVLSLVKEVLRGVN